MNNAFGIIIFLLVVAIIAAPICILFYNRYLNEYRNEIDAFLESKKLTFARKFKPEKDDWDKSPFDKSAVILFSIGYVNLAGMRINMTDIQHLIIQTKQGPNIWVEIETTFLFKPSLKFKNELVPKSPRTVKDIGNKATNECPACSYVLLDTDETCPDCGLHLK